MINNGRFGASGGSFPHPEMTLREWISRPGRLVDRVESLHIFRQILDVVDVAHQQRVIVRNIRPSCFVLSPFNRVIFIDSAGTLSSSERSSERSTGRAALRPTEWQGEDDDSSPVSGPFESTSHYRHDAGVSGDGRRLSSSPSSSPPYAISTGRYRAQSQILPNESGSAFNRATDRSTGETVVVSRNETSNLSWDGESNLTGWRQEFDDDDSLGSQISAGGRAANELEGLLPVQRVASDERSDGINRSISDSDRSASQECSRKSKDSPPREGKFPQRQTFLNEQKWYSSLEEMNGETGSFAADIYRLGVLFFELFCTFSTDVERVRVMGELRHRILPPRLLSEWPKESAFCLWLLHPEPTSRPNAREVSQCDLLKEVGDALSERQAAVNVEAKAAESDLLLEFLRRLQHDKQDLYRKMNHDVCRLTSDIKEIERRRLYSKRGRLSSRRHDIGEILRLSSINEDLLAREPPYGWERHAVEFGAQGGGKLVGSGKRPREQEATDEPSRKTSRSSGGSILGLESAPGPGPRLEQSSCNGDAAIKSARLMRNFAALEKVYFGMRWKVDPAAVEPLEDSLYRPNRMDGSSSVLDIGTNLLGSGDPGFLRGRDCEKHDWLGCFFDSLCKYARYSHFEVKATLRYGDLLNTANMVCSLSFDRDEEYFATAGVCKRIKIFECDSVLTEHGEIHYPLVEMATQSKLSSVCWNSYIKNHLASSDYDGTVQLWDACTSQTLMLYEEHDKRAWSVDFSKADPMKLASGSDDGCVKLWSINQESSIGTIKTKANVCCVQFAPDSSHLLVFGSADYKIYCYDLRMMRAPLSILASHRKAVSFVKFVDTTTLVSASTDNTLKIWDLTDSGSSSAPNPPCSLTYTGHLNERNFVGLSVADGYIACGSEKNSVFAYHKSMPMPITSHRFRDADPVTGQEIEENSGQFVSSVCWRGKSQTLVAGNSMGMIKILELV